MKIQFKKHTKIYIGIIVLLPFFLTNCDDNNEEETPEIEKVEVSMKATIKESSTEIEGASNINLKWQESSGIGINIKNGDYYAGGTYFPLASLDSKQAILTDKVTKDFASKLKSFQAYYPPYISNHTGIAKIPFLGQEQWGNTDNDLLRYIYMTAFYEGDANDISLEFEYQISILDFELTNNTNSNITIEGVLLNGPENAFYERFCPADKEASIMGTKQGTVITIGSGMATKNNESFPVHMVVYPISDSVLDGKTITITVYTNKGDYTFTKTIEKTFVKGKRYSIPLILTSENEHVKYSHTI